MVAASLRVEVLGPIRVHDADGRELAPAGRLQRRLLALLVLHRGAPVSADAAIEALWPTDLPLDPSAALQNHVARLRRLLPADVLRSVGSGYLLDAARADVDADRLVELLAGQPLEVAEQLAAILGRWHGPAYADLDDVDEAIAESGRLDDLRLRAREVIAESRLASGDLDGLVPDLTRLVGDAPLRERPRALLMTALEALGRHVEAIRAYDDFRRLLSDELGIEPSPSLTAHHAGLLAGSHTGRRPARSRLPAPTTTLLGRDDLVTSLVDQTSSHRLVTLVGPGGVGKTRLLVELGRRLAGHDERHVVWCELGQADPESVAAVVAAALGIDVRPGVSPVDRIVDVVGDDELTLLLDNCEHVLERAADVLHAVLTGCPHVSAVATSRERLRLAGEHLCPVVPLPVGDEHSPAVELFVERASAVVPGFQPDPTQRAQIASIATRLDGLPLAIELAAARLHGMQLDELAAGLDRRFELLADGYRASRHSSLSAAVSWSVDALTAERRRCFAALSLFVRPFTTADVQAVCDLDELAARSLLLELVERSLVQRHSDGRYAMLETLRAYGAECLAASSDVDHVAARHAGWMVEWVRRADHDLAAPHRLVLAELDEAIPELRTALGWLLQHDLVGAGRLVTGLVNYGFLRLRPDVLGWAELVLDRAPSDPNAPALFGASAYAVWMGGDVARSAALVEQGLLAERAAGMAPVPRLRILRGNVDLFEGRLDAAADWYQRAIEAAADDAAELLFARSTLLLAWGYAGDARAPELADELLRAVGREPTPHAAYAWYCAGEADLSFDVDRALDRLTVAVGMAEATNATFVRGIAGASKASIEARSGDPERAIADYRWLIEHWRRAGMWSTQWTILRAVAVLLERVGRLQESAVLEGAVRSTQAGHRIFGADAVALDDLSARLRAGLGEVAYEAALARGALLDGSAAAEHAVRSLAPAGG